jgi:GDPmannose 4,6-dehydratase
MEPRRALILGVTGQDGAYLAAFLLGKGYEVWGTSRAEVVARLKALGIAQQVRLERLELADAAKVREVLASARPHEVYHLAGQSSVAQSFDQPLQTLNDIAVGTLHVLEAVRVLQGPARLFHAGSGDCYGDTGETPADEDTPLAPLSPYGAAKAAAQLMVTSYRNALGLHASTGILFPHESPLRGENFVTRKIVDAAKRIAAGTKERLRLGNLAIERDWGWAPEYVEAMWKMLQQEKPADYVIATGRPARLERFVELAFAGAGLDWRAHVDVDPALFRPADPARIRANPAKAARELGWRARYALEDVVREMLKA